METNRDLWTRCVGIVGLTLMTTALGLAQEETSAVVVAVEEDWVLSLGQPDVNTGSPQVATQMNPDASQNSTYAIFCVNYQEIPSFVGSGMEIQLWYQDWVIDVDGSYGYKLAVENETISWTQSLKLESGRLIFSVKDGSSQTYGSFGGDTFQVSRLTARTDLNTYNADTSVLSSGVSFGANRVKSLKLKEVRYYKSDGTVTADKNIKVAYEEAVVVATQ